MIDFLVLSLLAGVGIALIAGPLGSFIVWRKMAYFGDTLAHSALIGIALGLAWDLNFYFSVALVSCAIAILLTGLQKKSAVATDTLLGILSHSSLALGLVAISFFSATQVNLYAYLVGDLLTVSMNEIFTIYVAAIIGNILIIYFWRPLIMISIDEGLAQAEGHNIARLRLLLLMIVALIIAIAMKVVGVLLITALLIIPAAASRKITSSPEAMAVVASLIGVISVFVGLAASYFLDTPAGPSIVLSSGLIFLLLTIHRFKTE